MVKKPTECNLVNKKYQGDFSSVNKASVSKASVSA